MDCMKCIECIKEGEKIEDIEEHFLRKVYLNLL